MAKRAYMYSPTLSCVGNNDAVANQAWATQLSEVWDRGFEALSAASDRIRYE